MRLLTLECERFRNLEPLRMEPHERFNVLEGDNGQGKTNLLEAIYLLATMRSFRDVARARTLIRWGEPSAIVRASLQRRETTRRLAVEVTTSGKRGAVDGQATRRLADYFGHLQVVVFGPQDLELTRGGPSLRRRFLDRAIFNVVPGYLEEARAYVQALQHRNELLRSLGAAPLDPALLGSFDEQVARRGGRVLWRRLRLLRDYRPIFEASLAEITGGEHRVTLRYGGGSRLPDALVEEADEDSLIEHLRVRIEETRSGDVRRRQTSVGPHVDDLLVELDDHPARLHASQGQHRALALAFKIAELQLAERLLDAAPILLLDDVSSELDRGRNAQLMEYLDHAGGQVFVTTTDRSWIQVRGATRVFRVSGGQVRVDPPASPTDSASGPSPESDPSDGEVAWNGS